MLKVKDNVDLSELEKFGFRKLNGYDYDNYGIVVRTRSKTIQALTDNSLDPLYDLIQAGLVEEKEE